MSLPAEDRVLSIAAHLGELCGQLRNECGPAKLVLPNGTFFPDPFEASARGVQRLLTRMQHHAGMLDVPVEVVVYDSEEEASAGGCSSGACAPKVSAVQQARFEADGDAWRLNMLRGELGHAVGLTTLLARGLGWLLLEETRPAERRGEPRPELVELAALRLGFGVLLLEGSHIYSKGCGGPQITRLTAFDTAELAVLVALFADAHRLPLRPTYAVLSTTQHSLLAEAEDLVRSNPMLSRWVREGRAGLSAGPRLNPPKARLFSWFRANPRPNDDALAEALVSGTLDEAELKMLLAPRSRATTQRKDAANDGISELVAEALQEPQP